MKPKKPVAISLNSAFQKIRNAAIRGLHVWVETASDGVVLRVDGEDAAYSVHELPPSFPIVGCDLLNYSGLSDLQQYFVGVLLPIEIWRARVYAKLGEERDIIGTSGTGDGALIAFKGHNDAIWQAVLFAARLWYEGRDCAYGRGLRVALGKGSCLRGQEFSGVAQLQGNGLVETSRILGCDKATHLLLSRSYWEMLTQKDETEVVGSFDGKRVRLKRGNTLFSGKSKPDDLLETSFVNCFGKVEEGADITWNFGDEKPEGLKRPGEKDFKEASAL